MNKKLVLGIVLIPMMLYLAISSTIRLMDAQENVRIAEHEVEIAKQEYAAANQEIDDAYLVESAKKYG